ncbi:MAG: anaerobic sulfatase maturase [Thermodesulfobacteriota bacterium]
MKPFSLLIKPASADCNLRCEYCFYLDRRALYPETSQHRMSDEILEALIRGYMATDQPQYVFAWQGGEPCLMGLDFYRRVVELQQRYGRGSASVANAMQTNAVLLGDEFVRHLARYHFLVGVSLDGPADIHDRYRCNAAGRGSHADVLGGISRLKRHEVSFNILTLVSDANVRRGREVYRYLREEGFLFQQYIPCVEFDGAGRLQGFSVSGEAWGDFLCEIYDEWSKGDTRDVSVRFFDAVLSLLVDGRSTVCHMAQDCSKYFVVEYNGDVYPCDFFVQRDLRLGNIGERSWKEFLQHPAYRRFSARKADWHKTCAACPYRLLCAGDCPKHRGNGGAGSPQLSSLCIGYKRFFDHALDGFRKLAEETQEERGNSPAPYTQPRAAKGVKRNDPCPCGSGRKYKRCCGR